MSVCLEMKGSCRRRCILGQVHMKKELYDILGHGLDCIYMRTIVFQEHNTVCPVNHVPPFRTLLSLGLGSWQLSQATFLAAQEDLRSQAARL